MARTGSRRDDILEAAAGVFVERGFDAATTREIGQRAGVLSGSLYHHFATKEEMLFALVRDVHTESLASLEYLDDHPGSCAERLRLLIEIHVGHLVANLERTTLALHESRSLTEEHAAVIAEAEERYAGIVTDLIDGGRRDGSLRADADPKLARMVVLGAANWVYRWYRPDGEHATEEIAAAIASFAVDGLAVGGPKQRGSEEHVAALHG
jgi:TetR/AcrR family transcriptional regulator, cholesterol catabolism regulator